MPLTREEIEKRLIQGQVNFSGNNGAFKVYIQRNSCFQYSAKIVGEYFDVVFQQHNEFNGLNWHLQQEQSQGHRVGSLSFWEDLADLLWEYLYSEFWAEKIKKHS